MVSADFGNLTVPLAPVPEQAELVAREGETVDRGSLFLAMGHGILPHQQ